MIDGDRSNTQSVTSYKSRASTSMRAYAEKGVKRVY